MKPIGPLMVEHRLIERMVRILGLELQAIKKGGSVQTSFIYAGVDFFKVYADRNHHGKEEDILFRKLAQKNLSPQDQEMMDRLIQEHIWARQAVGKLSDANSRYTQGDVAALEGIIHELEKLVNFYPMHIEKEDNHFFRPVMEYFSATEQDDMLDEFWEFDRKLIHEKYRKIVEDYEKSMLS